MADETVVPKTPDVRYTAKDFSSILEAVIIFVRNRFPDVKFDFSAENYFTILVNVLAYIGEMIVYTFEAGVRECFFFSAQLSESIRLHAEHIGYEVPGRVAATALVRLTLNQDSAFTILIPAGSKFASANKETAVSFQTLRDETIPPGLAGSYIDVYVEHSENFSATFSVAGDPFAEFVTAQRPVLKSGIDGIGSLVDPAFEISVDGIPYDQVDSFEKSEATDTHVIATQTNGGRLRLRFGNGVTGVAPIGTVLVEGRVGGGTTGNNAVLVNGPSFVNTNGEFINVRIGNSIVSSGGADEPDFATVRVQAPQSLRTNRRTVSRDDFILNSESVPGIDRALPLTYADDGSIPLNSTEVVVLTDSPTNAQIVGGNAAATATTDGLDDQFYISINGEPAQLIDLGSLIGGEDIAAAIQTIVRGMTPAYPLDNDEAYAGFICAFDAINLKYTLTTGQASLSASIVISAGTFDASVPLRIDTMNQSSRIIGATPSAAAQAAVLTSLTVTNPTMITHIVTVVGPQIKTIYYDFEVRFGPSASTAALKAAARDDIRIALAAFFSPRTTDGISNPEIDYGSTVRFSDGISVANGIDGVESIDEDTFIPADDVPLGLREFPVLGGVVVRDKTTGLPV